MLRTPAPLIGALGITIKMPRSDFVCHLQKQLGFIERSCRSYDDGWVDEAMRIAVAIRVLVHDTRQSVSLLNHLSTTDILLRSTSPVLTDDMIWFGGGLSTTQMIIESGKPPIAQYKPVLGDWEPKGQCLPAKEWWNQVIYRVNEGDTTRRAIVLGAANKDGGAHVDRTLDLEYEALRTGLMKVSYTVGADSGEFALPNSHLADLRQMGYEILNSPALRDLAESCDA